MQLRIINLHMLKDPTFPFVYSMGYPFSAFVSSSRVYHYTRIVTLGAQVEPTYREFKTKLKQRLVNIFETMQSDVTILMGTKEGDEVKMAERPEQGYNRAEGHPRKVELEEDPLPWQ